MAYRAEIEIGVRGTEKLRDLRKTIEDLSNKVNKLDELANTFQAPIQSVLNYTKAVQQATAALDKAELGSRDEADAIKLTARAIAEENAVRARRLFLLETEIKKQQGILRAAPTTGTVELGPGGLGFSGGFTAGQRQAANEEAILRVRREENKIRRQNLEILTREELFEIKLQRILERNAALEKQRQVARSSTREAASNAIIGGAFPLLFGQGIGAAAGGGLGGAIGGAAGGSLGFGLSLVGTAIGTTFDKAVTSAADFAKALRGVGDAAQTLETLLGSLDPTTANLIRNLQNSGQTAKAAEVTFNKLASVIGQENAKALEDAGNGWDKFTKRLGGLLTEISANVARTFKEVRREVPNIGGLVGFIGGLGLEGEKVKSAPALTPEAAQRLSNLQKETDILKTQAVLGTLSVKNNAEQFVLTSRRVAQQQFLAQQAEIEYKAKIGSISPAERLLFLEQARLKLQIDLNAVERQRIEENARAAKEAQDAFKRQVEEQRKLEVELNNETIKRLETSVEIVKFTKGEIAAYNEQLENVRDIYDLRKANLEAERDSALAGAQSAQAQRDINILYLQRLQALDVESRFDTAKIQRAKELLKIEQTRVLLEAQFAAQDRVRGVVQQQARIGVTLANPFDTRAQERETLSLEQRFRRTTELLPLEREIARIRQEVVAAEQNPLLMSAEKLQQTKDLLGIKQQELSTMTQQLNTLSAMEQQQQRLNEFTTQYGGIFDTIGQGMTSTFDLLIQGSEDWGRSLQQIASNVLTQIAQQLIQIYVIEQAIGFLKKVFAPTPIAGTGIGSLEANLQQYAPLPGFAAGGRPPVGKPSIVGERGPELFIPGSSGTIVPNHMLGGMGGDVSVVVNVDAKGTSAQGDPGQAKALGSAISAAVQAEIVKQQRPGGLLAGTR